MLKVHLPHTQVTLTNFNISNPGGGRGGTSAGRSANFDSISEIGYRSSSILHRKTNKLSPYWLFTRVYSAANPAGLSLLPWSLACCEVTILGLCIALYSNLTYPGRLISWYHVFGQLPVLVTYGILKLIVA